jgi:hypothetical protein
LYGAVAQLGERCVRNAEVEGSIPFRSTNKSLDKSISCEIVGSDLRVNQPAAVSAEFLEARRFASIRLSSRWLAW